MSGAATEKARLPRFSLVLGIESCCEVNDVSCLGMLVIISDICCTSKLNRPGVRRFTSCYITTPYNGPTYMHV